MKIESIQELTELMKLVNKHKINKLTIGDISLECNLPEVKKYQTKSTVKAKEKKALDDLDADLFFHETYEKEAE